MNNSNYAPNQNYAPQGYGQNQNYAPQQINYAPPAQHQYQPQYQQNYGYSQQPPGDDESRNYRYPSAKYQQGVNYAPQIAQFEVESGHHGSDDFRTIQKRIKKKEKKMSEWKVTCYKYASFIFALMSGFSAIMYFFMMLTGSVKDMSVSTLFISFIFTSAECYMFYTAYRSAADWELKDAKKAVQYFKIFMISYAIVFLIIAYNASDSTRSGKAYDPDEPESSTRDARILAIIVNEIFYGLFIYQAIKIRKTLYKYYMYKSQIASERV